METENKIIINSPAPIFEAEAFHGNDTKRVGLADYKGRWVVLFFYPADFSFVCPTELGDMADNYEEFKNKEGWRVRTEIKPLTCMTLNFIMFDDNKGDMELRADARMSVPFGLGGKEEKWSNIEISDTAYPDTVDHSDKVLERVEREYKIEVERYVQTVSATIEVRRGN